MQLMCTKFYCAEVAHDVSSKNRKATVERAALGPSWSPIPTPGCAAKKMNGWLACMFSEELKRRREKKRNVPPCLCFSSCFHISSWSSCLASLSVYSINQNTPFPSPTVFWLVLYPNSRETNGCQVNNCSKLKAGQAICWERVMPHGLTQM